MRFGDTIAAIATALGPAGLGVIRVSGPQALEVVQPLFSPTQRGVNLHKVASHRLLHGWIQEGEAPLDEVLLAIMRAPRSYTAEDVVEIQCHGSLMVLQTILQLLMKHGARLAEPGEFTQRAFLNGRLDLTRVEAISDLIHARSQLGMRVAINQLRGKLYQAIEGIKEDVAYVTALVEATIDFPEEDTMFTHRDDCQRRLEQARLGLQALLASAEAGKTLRAGLGVALIGVPNVGKSSLLNALLREHRAIVTEIPGTTRDLIEEALQIRGLGLRLVDTAGIREAEHPVEKEGIERSRQAWQGADLVLLLLDSSRALEAGDLELLKAAEPTKTLIVWNKIDLCPGGIPSHPALEGFQTVAISTKSKEGLLALENAIFERATQGHSPTEEQALITNLRQQQAAQKGLQGLEMALESLAQQAGEECLALDLRSVLRALGEIVGQTTTDDLLNRIFSEFCIGK